MGVAYCLFIVPQDRTFRPDSRQVANLANALREGGWVPLPQSGGHGSNALELLPTESKGGFTKQPVVEHAFPDAAISPAWIDSIRGHEMALSWSVQDVQEAKVEYPFTFDPWPESGSPYFDIRTVDGDDYFSEFAENIPWLEGTVLKCTCGAQLAYESGWSGFAGSRRIHRKCPDCGRAFDPSTLTCEIQDGWTGEPQIIMGGLTFRFALVINCGKYFPHEEERFRKFKPRNELLALWHSHIGVPFDQIDTVG